MCAKHNLKQIMGLVKSCNYSITIDKMILFKMGHKRWGKLTAFLNFAENIKYVSFT